MPPFPWTAFWASLGVFVITFLLGYIFYAAINRIAKVEDDYCQMRELKVRAEAADVAKSQVRYILGIVAFCNATKLFPMARMLGFLLQIHMFNTSYVDHVKHENYYSQLI
jgi:hypothetical protein